MSFYVPTTDDYLSIKLKEDAIPLNRRNDMFQLVCSPHKWMDYVQEGFMFSEDAWKQIQRYLRSQYPHLENYLIPTSVYGADLALRMVSWEYENSICIGRHKYTQKLIEASRRQRCNYIFEIVELEDEVDEQKQSNEVSSTKVREFIRLRDWIGLQEADIVPDVVLQYMQRNIESLMEPYDDSSDDNFEDLENLGRAAFVIKHK